jgi:hypothetical protein
LRARWRTVLWGGRGFDSRSYLGPAWARSRLNGLLTLSRRGAGHEVTQAHSRWGLVVVRLLLLICSGASACRCTAVRRGRWLRKWCRTRSAVVVAYFLAGVGRPVE